MNSALIIIRSNTKEIVTQQNVLLYALKYSAEDMKIETDEDMPGEAWQDSWRLFNICKWRGRWRQRQEWDCAEAKNCSYSFPSWRGSFSSFKMKPFSRQKGRNEERPPGHTRASQSILLRKDLQFKFHVRLWWSYQEQLQHHSPEGNREHKQRATHPSDSHRKQRKDENYAE